MNAAIEVEGLSHVYGGTVPALEDISLRVAAGRFTVIVGLSAILWTGIILGVRALL